MKKIGFLVNPVAGIGGKVGLKGSDGADTFKKALQLGAKPESENKAFVTMERVKEFGTEADFITCPGHMGESVCRKAGIEARILDLGCGEDTTSADTRTAAEAFVKEGVDLIVFAGGDGTARDILDAVGDAATVLGIPTGCKIHSGVYAINPRMAAVLIDDFARGQVPDTKEAEVMDIDEDRFREGVVQARLYGYLQIPSAERLVQNQKSGGAQTDQDALLSISEYIEDNLEDDVLYIIGTGSTTAAVMKHLDLPNTLLGVDLLYNGEVLAQDCTEKEILDYLDRYPKAKIMVTVIGGQGYIFGRGNQQLSAEVIRRVGKENIMIVATRNKILSLKGAPLYADTGNEEVNDMLTGYMRVIVGYDDMLMAKVAD